MTNAVDLPSTAANQTAKRQRFRLVAIGAGLYALSGPGQTAGFSVFVDPVTETLDISRGQLTAGYLVATLLAAPSGILLGRQLDHRNIATVIRTVGGGLAVALGIAAASPALWMLIIGIFGLRLFGQTGFTLTSSVHVARSITHRRGAALGALAAAGGAAITLTPLIASRLIPHLGWRYTWLLLAAVVLAAAHALAHAVATTPTETDPTPASDTRPEPVPTGEALSSTVTDRGSARRRRAAFVVVASGYATTAAIGTALGFHQIAILEERDLTASAAAANFLPQSLAAATVALTIGRVVDRVNGRVMIPICMTLLTAALLAVRLIDSTPTAILYGIILGSAGASMGASEGTLLARWLGTDSLGKIRERLMATIVTASAVGPLAFTALANTTGSYTNAATATIALPITVSLLAAFAPLPTEAAT
ncbi:MAG: MFS transporter [Ilumatobacteraceae bacterium]